MNKTYYLKRLKKLEREVIGNSLAYTHYLDYHNLRKKDDKFLEKLFRATDNLRKFRERYDGLIEKL